MATHVQDGGLGWVWYPRGVLDGLTLEVGALGRFRHLRNYIDEDNVAHETRYTQTYAGRLMIGWTWRLPDRFFFAVAVGLAVGHERGEERRYSYEPMAQDIDTPVSRSEVSPETYVRMGLAFGD